MGGDGLHTRDGRASARYAALAIGLSLVVYAPILRNYFWQDDFLALQYLTNWPLGRFLTMRWAGHLVIVRNAFYAAMYALAGANPMPYYVVLLALHAINVGLLFAIVHTVARSAPLACLAAAVWGTCPINEGALGWIAPSGNVMVATTTLAVLYDAVRAVWQHSRIGCVRAALWAALLLAGAQSFGTGLGVAIAAPAALLWLACGRLTRAAGAVLLGVPIVTAWMYGRDYTELTGRFVSSTLVKATLLFDLLAIGMTTLLRGLAYEPEPFDFVFPPNLGPLPSSLPSMTVLAALVVVLLWMTATVWLATGRTRRLLTALAVLALANYGTIAVGRAYVVELFHQSVVRWAAQQRYHYSATAILAIGLAVTAATVCRKRLAVWAPAALLVWLAVFAILYAQTGWTIRHYDAERQRAERILARIDAAIRATPAGEPVVTYNEPYWDGPHIAGAASLYVMNRDTDAREVYFVDRAAVAIYRDFPGSRLARVLVPPPSTGVVCREGVTLQSERQ